MQYFLMPRPVTKSLHLPPIQRPEFPPSSPRATETTNAQNGAPTIMQAKTAPGSPQRGKDHATNAVLLPNSLPTSYSVGASAFQSMIRTVALVAKR